MQNLPSHDSDIELQAAYAKMKGLFTDEQIVEIFLQDEVMIPFEDVLKDLEKVAQEEPSRRVSA